MCSNVLRIIFVAKSIELDPCHDVSKAETFCTQQTPSSSIWDKNEVARGRPATDCRKYLPLEARESVGADRGRSSQEVNDSQLLMQREVQSCFVDYLTLRGIRIQKVKMEKLRGFPFQSRPEHFQTSARRARNLPGLLKWFPFNKQTTAHSDKQTLHNLDGVRGRARGRAVRSGVTFLIGRCPRPRPGRRARLFMTRKGNPSGRRRAAYGNDSVMACDVP
ncbi:hypothetical protein EVAR_36869_1 [Eumeta japonica]|uniref:Uncharacterized protein n=1 Tax=Eumeta variegata TaxID=151549 RepID=A0A4C1WR62_EUMVA|nr:hypothetical protein EVAR_36869_1 [Eumeta japonica]